MKKRAQGAPTSAKALANAQKMFKLSKEDFEKHGNHHFWPSQAIFASYLRTNGVDTTGYDLASAPINSS